MLLSNSFTELSTFPRIDAFSVGGASMLVCFACGAGGPRGGPRGIPLPSSPSPKFVLLSKLSSLAVDLCFFCFVCFACFRPIRVRRSGSMERCDSKEDDLESPEEYPNGEG